MTDKYTPTTEQVRDAVTFPRRRLGEPRDMTDAEFDRWLNEVKAEAWAEGAFAGWTDCESGQEKLNNPYRTQEG